MSPNRTVPLYQGLPANPPQTVASNPMRVLFLMLALALIAVGVAA